MRILIVASGNHEHVAPFITEQADSLQEAGCNVNMYLIKGNGVIGYLRNLKNVKKNIRDFDANIVHAHYGLCGLLCTLQRKVPVVVTYHGSDINNRRTLLLSRIAIRRAAHNIFVSKKLKELAFPNNKNSSVLPCGVDTGIFKPVQRDEACQIMHLDPQKHYVLFAGAFDNSIKNPQLAKDACALLPAVKLLELKGYTRTEVAALMNAADCLLMTSHNEGSPQVVKEALACGCPIVSVDVGDVAELTKGIETCRIAHVKKPSTIASLISDTIQKHERVCEQRQIILRQLDNKNIARQLITIYHCLI